MGEFVHFKGKDAIVRAYEQNGIPSFALVSGKDLLYQYTGEDLDEGSTLLGEFIDMLAEGHSQGIYQLRMYKSPPRDLTLKVPANFSFKCRLQDAETQYSYMPEDSAYAKRIKALEDRLASQETGDDEEEYVTPSWQEKIGAILERPEVQNYLLPKIFAVMDKLFGGGRPAAVVGSVPETAKPEPVVEPGQAADSTQLYMNLPVDQREALDQAMAILLRHDPEIGTNLLKCATLLKTNPGKYRMAVSML